MKNQRKNTKKRGVPLALYLTVCLAIIVSAYFHLSRIAQNFNTQQLELITGLYAEKMNESMEYLQNYVKEDVKMIQAMENKEPEKIQKRLEVSIMIEQLRKLGVYELLQGKINVHLLKVDSENFITCISSNEDTTANGWNNLLLQQKYFKYDENYS